MAVICKDFLARFLVYLGYEELMSDRVDDVAYLSDVCQYILQEITAAKTARDQSNDGEIMSFNLLTDPLPDSVEINGTDYLINPDHRTIIRILLILEDTTFYDEERRQMALFLFYKQALEDEVIAF